MVVEDTAEPKKTFIRKYQYAMHHGENVLMVLDQDSNEVRLF
jgi:excinuclease ABC subunit A